MSRLRSSLVNGDVLAELALELGLDRHLRLGQGEEKSGGRQRPSILADALEAMIAAIYLDANESTCRECVLRWFAARLQKSGQRSQRKDAKSALQEWMQAHRYPLPVYTVVATEGQAHEQVFRVRCVVEGLAHESFGEASSRRRAEQMAAEKYLELINGRK
jgi:ribonuclease-3